MSDRLSIPAKFPTKRQMTEEKICHEDDRRGCDTIHVCVVRDGSALRSRRRLLYYERRSSSSWLRLSEHGDVPGGLQRHRWHMCAQPFVRGPRQRPRLSAKTIASASQASSRGTIIRDSLRSYSRWRVPVSSLYGQFRGQVILGGRRRAYLPLPTAMLPGGPKTRTTPRHGARHFAGRNRH
jgi:hypothetical protein